MAKLNTPGFSGGHRVNEWGLTDSREKFAQLVASGEVSNRAAYRASYNVKRMQDQVIDSRATELMADSRVRARIAMLQKEAADKVVLKLADVLEETRRIMLATPAGIIDAETGKIKLPHELDAATAAAIQSFEIDDLGRIKYKFWDKNASLERAAKILGAFEKDNRQKADPLQALLDRLQGNVFKPSPDAAKPAEPDEREPE